MSIDRAVLAFAGVMILVSIALTQFVSPWWWLFTAFIGLNLLQSSLTRAVFFSAMTTATAFGSLWLSSHPGTSSILC